MVALGADAGYLIGRLALGIPLRTPSKTSLLLAFDAFSQAVPVIIKRLGSLAPQLLCLDSVHGLCDLPLVALQGVV